MDQIIQTIRDREPEDELYGGLAEELSEAAAMAEKVRRILSGKSPTPTPLADAKAALAEEIGDVLNYRIVLDIQPDPALMTEKLNRWARRIDEKPP